MRHLFITLMLMLSMNTHAEEKPAKWVVMPGKSTITFQAVQNHAPVQGEFSRFDAAIYFDKEKLPQSSVRVEIDMMSVSTAYGEVAENLKKQEWFAVNMFPQATFESTQLRHKEGNQYEAEGRLTIRDKTIPVTLPFTLDFVEEKGKTVAKMAGRVVLNRTDFGVGQGEWQDTKVVEDKVEVKVELGAYRE